MKKIKIKNIIIIFIVIIILIIALLIFKKITKNPLIGTWTTDGITVYQFKNKNTGSLIVPLSEYKFTYKIDGNKLYIDFENEKSNDSDYEYSFKDNKLILKGINKTSGTYVFKKK